MIIIGVDYGDARTGLAVCDKNEILASALTTVNESYAPKLIDKIIEIAIEKKAEAFVVGKPYNMDGSAGSRAQKCEEFAGELESKSGMKTFLCDERMTTVIAHNSLNFTNTRGKKRKQAVDSLSAQIILQDFIDKNKRK